MLVDRINFWASQTPDKVAIFTNGMQFSYAQFGSSISSVAHFLSHCHLNAPGTAAIMIPDRALCWVVSLAVRLLGIDIITVVHPRHLEMLASKDIISIIMLDQAHAENLPDVPLVKIPADVFTGYTGVFPMSNGPFGGHFLYTSGTTGQYKKIFLPAETEDWRNDEQVKMLGFTSATIHKDMFQLHNGPSKHTTAAWHCGGSVSFFSNHFQAQQGWRLKEVFQEGVNHVTMVPNALRALIEEARLDRNCFLGHNVRLTVGGGFTSLDLLQKAQELLFSQIKIWYSSTEVEGMLTSDFHDEDSLLWLRPVEGRSVEIVTEDGHQCLDGEEGILRVARSVIDADCYYDDEVSTSTFFRGGYFYPGDLAARRKDGRFRVIGRTGDVLNITGHKFAVAPIEAQLQTLLSGKNVCLFSTLNDRNETELIAAIETNVLPPKYTIMPFINSFSRSFESIKIVSIPKFPVSENGMEKINRAAVRAIAIAAAPIKESNT